MQHIYNFDVLQEGPLGPGARNLSRLEGCMGDVNAIVTSKQP